jgi:ATP-dependent Clp protease ATP-binding subunit ClpA
MRGVAALAPDAAMALGIAATAMPFARTPAGEAERWLRVLRLHGEAGVALQALGVSEGPLEDPGDEQDREPHVSAATRAPDATSSVTRVTELALDIADQRGTASVGTKDLLLAVMQVYDKHFDRVLRAHGTDRRKVLERLEPKA